MLPTDKESWLALAQTPTQRDTRAYEGTNKRQEEPDIDSDQPDDNVHNLPVLNTSGTLASILLAFTY